MAHSRGMSVPAASGRVEVYGKMRDTSLNSMIFEILLNRGKIGFRMMPYSELTNFTQTTSPRFQRTM
jgi:hypothetical protein